MVGGLSVALSCALGLAWLIVPPSAPALLVRPTAIGKRVIAVGRIVPENEVSLGPQSTGVVTQVLVTEGKYVHARQLLVQLDDRQARAALFSAKEAVAQAEANLHRSRSLEWPQAEAALQQSAAHLRQALELFEREQKLYFEGATTRETYEQSRHALEVVRGECLAARVLAIALGPKGRSCRRANG